MGKKVQSSSFWFHNVIVFSFSYVDLPGFFFFFGGWIQSIWCWGCEPYFLGSIQVTHEWRYCFRLWCFGDVVPQIKKFEEILGKDRSYLQKTIKLFGWGAETAPVLASMLSNQSSKITSYRFKYTCIYVAQIWHFNNEENKNKNYFVALLL